MIAAEARVRDPAKASSRRRGAAVLALAALAFIFVLVIQRTLAAQLGAWLGAVWVGVMETLLRILGAFLGG